MPSGTRTTRFVSSARSRCIRLLTHKKPATAKATPKDYAKYVLSLGQRGAKITDIVNTKVDGRPATLMTLTNDGGPQSGSLGCPEHGNDQVEECFGIQPEYELRLAVMNSGPPLVIWARTPSEHPDPGFFTSFEQMLDTVRFQ
jgi:hypothetical protein